MSNMSLGGYDQAPRFQVQQLQQSLDGIIEKERVLRLA